MHRILFVTLITLGLTSRACLAIPPGVKKSEAGFSLEHVSQECPIIYDNDWWTDVPDAR
jgi:hypothetical protein